MRCLLFSIWLSLLTHLVPCFGVVPFLGKPPLGAWEKVADLESSFVKAAASKALQLHEAENVNGKAERLSMVVDCYTQIVLGVNYRLVLQVNLLNCSAEKAIKNQPEECVAEQVGLCYFHLHTEPWTSTYELIWSFCSGFVPSQNSQPASLINIWLTLDPAYHVARRHASSSVTLYDGSYKLESLLEVSVRNTYNFMFQFVEYKFSLEVVDQRCEREKSLDYCDKKLTCDFVLNVELWSDWIKLTSKDCKLPITEVEPVVGGWFPVDSSSPAVQEVVRKAVKVYESQGNMKVLAIIVDGVSAQIVAGMNYKIKLQLVDCQSEKMVGLCDNFKYMTCLFEVYERSWTSTFNLKATCNNKF